MTSFVSNLDAVTVQGLGLALDAAMYRQQVIATNIANVGTKGYQAQQAVFELGAAPDDQNPATLQSHTLPKTHELGEQTVHLDQEMASMAQNTTHYQSLLRALNRQLSILQSAVTEGKH